MIYTVKLEGTTYPANNFYDVLYNVNTPATVVSSNQQAVNLPYNILTPGLQVSIPDDAEAVRLKNKACGFEVVHYITPKLPPPTNFLHLL